MSRGPSGNTPRKSANSADQMMLVDLSSTGIGDYALLTHEGFQRLQASRIERSQMSIEALEDMRSQSLIEAKASAQGAVDGEMLNYWYMLDIVGNVAILNIDGVLVNNDDIYNRFFGEVGYPEIYGALLEATSKPQIDTILMLMNTPGGAVSGISDLTDSIKELGKTYKIHAHAASSACSGGYWLSCAASSISASGLAEIGSIGVISVLRSVYRMYKEMGIDTKVLRQGKYKALGNPYEPLSDEAEKVILDQMAVVYDTFLNVVSDARGMTVQALKDTAAEGRVFFGVDAIKVGLVDTISSFEQVLGSLLRVDTVNTSSTGNIDMKNGKGKLKILSKAAQAAIASGVDPKVAAEDPDLQPTAEEIAEAEAKAKAEAEANGGAGGEGGEGAGGEGGEGAGGEGGEPAPQAAATAGQGADILALSRELGTLSVKIATLENTIAVLQTEKTELQSSVDALRPIAIQACHNMQIALGGSAIPMDAVAPAAIAAQYTELKTKVEARFPVGGLAEARADSDDNAGKNTAGNVTQLQASARNLTTFGKKKPL